MKRNAVIILSVTSIIVFIAVLALLVLVCIIPVWNIASSQLNDQETFLMSSQSPDGQYVLEAYRTEPGATVDFSIKVYETNGNRKALIYNAYHEYEVEIVWIDNSTVTINGKTLDLSRGEKYDWRTQ